MPKKEVKPKRGRPSLGLTTNLNIRLHLGQPERIEALAERSGVDASVIHRLALEMGLAELERSVVLPNLKALGVQVRSAG